RKGCSEGINETDAGLGIGVFPIRRHFGNMTNLKADLGRQVSHQLRHEANIEATDGQLLTHFTGETLCQLRAFTHFPFKVFTQRENRFLFTVATEADIGQAVISITSAEVGFEAQVIAIIEMVAVTEGCCRLEIVAGEAVVRVTQLGEGIVPVSYLVVGLALKEVTLAIDLFLLLGIKAAGLEVVYPGFATHDVADLPFEGLA